MSKPLYLLNDWSGQGLTIDEVMSVASKQNYREVQAMLDKRYSKTVPETKDLLDEVNPLRAEAPTQTGFWIDEEGIEYIVNSDNSFSISGYFVQNWNQYQQRAKGTAKEKAENYQNPEDNLDVEEYMF